MVGKIYKNNFNSSSIALKYKDDSITYEELDIKVKKYATYFSSIGVKQGDKVVLSCLNSPEFIYSYLGIVSLGAIIVPINMLLTFDEISYIIKNCGAKTIIVHPIILSKLKESDQSSKKIIASLLNSSIIQGIFKIANINLVILDEKFDKKINAITKYNYNEAADENLVSTFLYTSGTTGRPKAAMLTHKNLLSNVMQAANTIDISSTDNFMCVLPMFHVFAFTVCVLLPLFRGGTITILPRFIAKEFVDSLVEDEITILCGVPSMYIVLLDAIKSHIDFPKLRLAISGGAGLPIEIYHRAKAELNFPIIEGYGLSEASPAVCFNPIDCTKAGSIGVPLKGVECKIVDENGTELPTGEVGEIIVKGDNIMLGYYNEPEKTKETIKDGWLYTGDMGKKDEDGYYFIVDRKKELIIVGGLNVYPREIEEVLYKHPKVKEAAVIGIMDDLRGEYAKAFVVLKDGQQCYSKEILRYLKQYLAQYKIPRSIQFINEMPKNATGKILKRQLKEIYQTKKG